MSDSNLGTWPMDNDSILNAIDGINPVAQEDSQDKMLLARGLKHKHMIETLERFEWTGLPPELNADLIERVLYFRFKGSLFYTTATKKFLFLPFALKGKNSDTIDSYGRYSNITPVLFTGQWKQGGDGKTTKDISFITNKDFTVVYDMPGNKAEEDTEMESDNEATEPVVATVSPEAAKQCVILTDSSLGISQDYTPMEYIIRPYIEQLTDILVLVNMDLISSAKVFYVVAKDSDQKGAIEAEFRNLDTKILNGKRVVVVTSATDLKELIGKSSKDTARYFQSYQSIDNLRKDLIGADNGGTFMKQEHQTEMESETNGNSSPGGSFVLNNALRMRQDFAKIANEVFGLDIQVEIKGGAEEESIAPQGAATKEIEETGGDE